MREVLICTLRNKKGYYLPKTELMYIVGVPMAVFIVILEASAINLITNLQILRLN